MNTKILLLLLTCFEAVIATVLVTMTIDSAKEIAIEFRDVKLGLVNFDLVPEHGEVIRKFKGP